MAGVHDPVKVDEAKASLFGGCGLCKNQKGPFTHANVEVPGIGIFYLCANCVRLHARAMGLDSGDEQAKLLHAAQHETEMQKRLEKALESRKKLSDKYDAERALTTKLAEQLDQRDGRVEQLEALIRADAEAKLAVVTS